MQPNPESCVLSYDKTVNLDSKLRYTEQCTPGQEAVKIVVLFYFFKISFWDWRYCSVVRSLLLQRTTALTTSTHFGSFQLPETPIIGRRHSSSGFPGHWACIAHMQTKHSQTWNKNKHFSLFLKVVQCEADDIEVTRSAATRGND